ncbi:hypothetical protein AC579_8180 [Pseudocercospora musae]|uniref:Transcription factor domain-containing protein n=1 Tax=Pseudocercospora musae TaxID=113226 RepID=A0A139IV20_9PEZI|nr:hypothetical protein AC579_8180 [Pseudocercospora musae]
MATSLAILLSTLYTLDPGDSQALVAIGRQILSMRYKDIQYPPLVLYSTQRLSSVEDVSFHLVQLSLSELAYFLNAARRGHNADDSERMYGTAQRNLAELDACAADLVRSIINGMLGTFHHDISTSPLPSFSSLQILPRSKLQHVLLSCHVMTEYQLSWFLLETGYTLPVIQNPSATSKLLNLPAEMRNWIYREALCEDSWIKIDQDTFAQPALLRTCKQIRHEASSIYYHENRFEVAALDMKRQLAVALVRQAGVLLDLDKVRIRTPWIPLDGHGDPVADAGQGAAFRELWDGDVSAYGWQHVAAGYGERFCIEA